MTCPYPDCTKKDLSGEVERCPQCSRPLKPCAQCGELNRAFANFCRACGRELAGEALDWSGFKGGPERSGLNPYGEGEAIRSVTEIENFDLEDRCRSLLLSDDHLIVASLSGRIEVIDVKTRQRKGGWKVEGPLTCEPCVHRGSLYLGAKQRITAYTLGGLSLSGRQLEPRWEARIDGTPVQALLGFDDRLYMNMSVSYRDGTHSEIQILDGVGGRRPTAAQTVHAASCLSTPAGSLASRRVAFLSEEDEGVTVHLADHGKNPRPLVSKQRVKSAPRNLKRHLPVAAVRSKLYAVFGDDGKLCSIDAERGVFGVVVKDDVQNFALSGPSDGVLVRSGAMFFLYRNRPEPLTPDDRINGAPVIVSNRAAFVGMKDGRIRWYDLGNPSAIGEKHLSDSSEEVTALASFRDYIVAGGSRGTVRLYRLGKHLEESE